MTGKFKNKTKIKEKQSVHADTRTMMIILLIIIIIIVLSFHVIFLRAASTATLPQVTKDTSDTEFMSGKLLSFRKKGAYLIISSTYTWCLCIESWPKGTSLRSEDTGNVFTSCKYIVKFFFFFFSFFFFFFYCSFIG